jgi:hypothetical protein
LYSQGVFFELFREGASGSFREKKLSLFVSFLGQKLVESVRE